MGTRNTTQLIFRPSKHHNMPKAGAGEFANAYNHSYKGKLAHDVVMDRNPGLAAAAMMSDPLKYTRAKAISKRYYHRMLENVCQLQILTMHEHF